MQLAEIIEFQASPQMISKIMEMSIPKKFTEGVGFLQENAHIRSIPIVTSVSLRVMRNPLYGTLPHRDLHRHMGHCASATRRCIRFHKRSSVLPAVCSFPNQHML
jgi:hypothetical protein